MTSEIHPLFFTADFAGELDEDSAFSLYDAKLYILPSREHRWGDEQHLATLRGLRIDPTSQGVYQKWRLNVNHATAYDFEHDGVHLLDMTIQAPTIASGLRPGYTEVVGIVSSIYAYASPQDAFITQPDDDGHLHPDSRPCSGCDQSHPKGRYRASSRDEMRALTGQMVMLVLTPLSATPLDVVPA